jgi:hypothetical protein
MILRMGASFFGGLSILFAIAACDKTIAGVSPSDDTDASAGAGDANALVNDASNPPDCPLADPQEGECAAVGLVCNYPAENPDRCPTRTCTGTTFYAAWAPGCALPPGTTCPTPQATASASGKALDKSCKGDGDCTYLEFPYGCCGTSNLAYGVNKNSLSVAMQLLATCTWSLGTSCSCHGEDSVEDPNAATSGGGVVAICEAGSCTTTFGAP